jgi:hypothetical protein
MADESNTATGGANNGAAGQNQQAQQSQQNQQGQGASNNQQPKVLTLTEEELEKRLQSETDKRVTEAIKTSRTKWEQEYDQRIKKERDEATRLAKMNEDERQKELDKKREADLTARERALNLKEMENQAMLILGQKNLPVEFAKQLLGETAEDIQGNITAFEKAWNAELDKRIAEKLRGKIPPADNQQQKKNDANAQIRRMAGRR